MNPSVEGHFDSFPGGYGRHGEGLWAAYRRLAFAKLRPHLPPGPLRVLDVGGGSLVSLPGLLASPEVADYLVVDLVDKLPRASPKLRVSRGDALEFCASYSGPRFHAAVLFGVLMYLPPDGALRLLRSTASLLEPGGAVLIHEPNERSAPYLDGSLERPVDVTALAREAGLRELYRADFNVPACRAAAARLDRALGPLGPSRRPLLGRALLTLEAAAGRGLDTLFVGAR